MEINHDLKKLEEKVMEMLLKGDHPTLSILNKQWENSEIENINLTGVGFFIDYKVSDKLLILPGAPSFPFGDVFADLDKLEGPAGFVLFIENGYIKTLEGYITDDAWPKKIEINNVYYFGGLERNWEKLSRELK